MTEQDNTQLPPEDRPAPTPDPLPSPQPGPQPDRQGEQSEELVTTHDQEAARRQAWQDPLQSRGR